MSASSASPGDHRPVLDSDPVLSTSLKCSQRQQLENVYISELAQLISTADMDASSKTSVQQIGNANGCSSDAVQLGEISSSRPVLFANDFGPLLLEALEAFGFIVNASFQIEYVTENVSELIGHRADQLVGQSVFQLLHQHDQQLFSAVVQPLLQPHSRGCQPDTLQRSRIVTCRILVNTRGDPSSSLPSNAPANSLATPMESKSAVSDHTPAAEYESMQISVLKKMRPPELVLIDDSSSMEPAVDTQLLVCMARRVTDIKSATTTTASPALSIAPSTSPSLSSLPSTSPSMLSAPASAPSLPSGSLSSHTLSPSPALSSHTLSPSPALSSHTLSPVASATSPSETFVTRLDASGKILSLDAQNSSRARRAHFNQELVGRSLVSFTHRADQVRLAAFLQRVSTAGDHEGVLFLDEVRVQSPVSAPGRFLCLQTRARRLITSGDGMRCIISALHTVTREEASSPSICSPALEVPGLHSTRSVNDTSFTTTLDQHQHTSTNEFSDQDLFSELFGDTPLAPASSSLASSVPASLVGSVTRLSVSAAVDQRFSPHTVLAAVSAVQSPGNTSTLSDTQSLMQDLLTSDSTDRKPTTPSTATILPLIPLPVSSADCGTSAVSPASVATSGGGGCDNMLRQLLNDRNESRSRPSRNEELMQLLNGSQVEQRRRSTSASAAYSGPVAGYVEGHTPVTGIKRGADEDLAEPQKQAKRHARCVSGNSSLDITGGLDNKNKMLSELLSRSCQRVDNTSPIPSQLVRPSDLPQNKLPCREELQRKLQLNVRAAATASQLVTALAAGGEIVDGAGVESLLLARAGDSNGLSVNSVSSSVVNNNNGDSSELDNILDDIITFENQLSGTGSGASGQFVASPASVPTNVNEKNAIHNIQWYLMQTESNVATPPSAQCAPVRNVSAGMTGPPPYSVVRAPVGGLTSQINMVRSQMPLQPGVSQNKLTSQQMAELHRLLQQQQKQHMVAASSAEHVLQSSLHSFDPATINSVPPNVALQTQVPNRIASVSQQNSSDIAAASPHSPFSASYRQQQQQQQLQHQLEACSPPVAPPRPLLIGSQQQQGVCPNVAPPINTSTLRPTLAAGRLQQQNPELNAQLSGVYDVRGQSYQLAQRSSAPVTGRVSAPQQQQQYGFSQQQMVRAVSVGVSPAQITGVASNQSTPSAAFSWQSEFVRQELRRSIVNGQQQQPRPGGRSLTREDLEQLGLQVPPSSVGENSWLPSASPSDTADISSDPLTHQPVTLPITANHPPLGPTGVASAHSAAPSGAHRSVSQPSLLRNLLLSE